MAAEQSEPEQGHVWIIFVKSAAIKGDRHLHPKQAPERWDMLRQEARNGQNGPAIQIPERENSGCSEVADCVDVGDGGERIGN